MKNELIEFLEKYNSPWLISFVVRIFFFNVSFVPHTSQNVYWCFHLRLEKNSL